MLPLPQSPPPSHSRAGSLEASPSSSSSSHRTALLPSCSPHTPPPPSPPLEHLPQEEETTNQREAATGKGKKAGLEDKTLFCPVTLADDDSQSQSQFELVAAATEPTKDKNQLNAEPSEREEEEEEEPPETTEPTASDMAAALVGQQPMRERKDAEEEAQGEGVTDGMDEEGREGTEQEDQSDVEEDELVSPVLELDHSLDMEVMELMTSSSPPPSLLHLSSSSPPPFSRRGKGRTLRPPPFSTRPSDDLSIRLRQSPFSTEASPETSPTRAPVTPPPLSPPSPPLRSSPPARESPPLSKVNLTRDNCNVSSFSPPCDHLPSSD